MWPIQRPLSTYSVMLKVPIVCMLMADASALGIDYVAFLYWVPHTEACRTATHIGWWKAHAAHRLLSHMQHTGCWHCCTWAANTRSTQTAKIHSTRTADTCSIGLLTHTAHKLLLHLALLSCLSQHPFFLYYYIAPQPPFKQKIFPLWLKD